MITFHRLAPKLTRVEVVFDWQPKGVVDSHRNVLHNVMRYTNTLCIGRNADETPFGMTVTLSSGTS